MGEINRQRLCGMLGFAMRAGRLVLGTEQVCVAMARSGDKRPRLVLISHEASANTKKKLTTKGEFYGIQTTTIDLRRVRRRIRPRDTHGARHQERNIATKGNFLVRGNR